MLVEWKIMIVAVVKMYKKELITPLTFVITIFLQVSNKWTTSKPYITEQYNKPCVAEQYAA